MKKSIWCISLGICMFAICGFFPNVVNSDQLVVEGEIIDIDLKKTAVVVIDPQNAFVSKGGFFDLQGFDYKENQVIIEPIKKICTAARQKGVKVINVAHVLSPDLHEVSQTSTFWHKSVKDYIENPKWKDAYLIRGTWGAEYPEEIKPKEGDIWVEKPRFSAFFGTNLDGILKAHDIKYLIFTGIATNVCVEASIRDGGHLGYFPILVSDATKNAGPPITQQATIFNVNLVYGWITNTENVLKTLK